MYRCLILVLALAGCAMQQSQSPSWFKQPADLYHPAEYPLYFDAVQADLFWRCMTPEEGGVRIEGYVMSSLRTSLPIYDFQVQLYARDAKGKIVADRWTQGDLAMASPNEQIPFAVSLPATGEGLHYDLYYWFQYPGAGGGGGRVQVGPRIALAQAGLLPVSWTIQDVCDEKWRQRRGI
jgi:hypothetical protein